MALKAKTSPSDLSARQPISGKGKADGNGHNGAALAVVFIRETEEVAKKISAAQKSLKDRLSEIVKLTRDDHLAFRKTIDERVAQINVEATKLNLTVTAYRESDPSVNYVYTSLSEFLRLSRACETGWKPDLKRPWAEIKASATAALNAKANPTQPKEPPAELVKEKTELEQKLAKAPARQKKVLKAKIEEVQSKIAEAMKVTAGPTAKKAGRKGKTGAQKAIDLIKALPAHEVFEVAAWLEKYINSPQMARLRPTSTTGDQPPASDRIVPNRGAKLGEATSKGAVGTEADKPTTEERETAPAAKGTRRKARA